MLKLVLTRDEAKDLRALLMDPIARHLGAGIRLGKGGEMTEVPSYIKRLWRLPGAIREGLKRNG